MDSTDVAQQRYRDELAALRAKPEADLTDADRARLEILTKNEYTFDPGVPAPEGAMPPAAPSAHDEMPVTAPEAASAPAPSATRDAVFSDAADHLALVEEVLDELLDVLLGRTRVDESSLLERADLAAKAMTFVPEADRPGVQRALQAALTGGMNAYVASATLTNATTRAIAEAIGAVRAQSGALST